MLTPELHPGDLTIAQMLPQHPFRVRCIAPQFS
jgi:hypothetical protein